jgi:hypothetical protein
VTGGTTVSNGPTSTATGTSGNGTASTTAPAQTPNPDVETSSAISTSMRFGIVSALVTQAFVSL